MAGYLLTTRPPPQTRPESPSKPSRWRTSAPANTVHRCVAQIRRGTWSVIWRCKPCSTRSNPGATPWLNNETVARPVKRSSERVPITVPARITWKDASGAVRFASVMTRDISEAGVFVECEAGAAIPLYRLVHLQVERSVGVNRPAADAASRRPRAVGGVARGAVPPFDRHAVGLRAAVPGRSAGRCGAGRLDDARSAGGLIDGRCVLLLLLAVAFLLPVSRQPLP